MPVDGYDSPTLRIMAGESGPFGSFEMRILLDQVVREIDLVPFASEREACLVPVTVRARQILRGEVGQAESLSEIQQLRLDLDMSEELMEFARLKWARHDLEVAGDQYYWGDAHRGNIGEAIDEYRRGWINAHPGP